MSTTEITPATPPPSADKSKRRKAKAILAGGLVLGIGAAVTLAAWNDSEFAKGIFDSGHFDIEGTADPNVNFADHEDDVSAAALTFTTSFSNMSPGGKVAAPYALRLDKDSTYKASVSVDATADGDANAISSLSYTITQVASFAACHVDPTGTSIAQGATLDSAVNNTPVVLETSANVGTDAGDEKFLCIQVTAGSGLEQDKTVTATWEFIAESQAA
ncbi:SipW-dependent-type signal peptide-containing protein [Arthrobacter sp. NPDC056493]|uniref:SipW-dependent-type signal peptide-containing protein n=1 Tax=Arthrobacter sp. NPDC056493 TaxID=3345839 RepID=UPI0036719564